MDTTSTRQEKKGEEAEKQKPRDLLVTAKIELESAGKIQRFQPTKHSAFKSLSSSCCQRFLQDIETDCYAKQVCTSCNKMRNETKFREPSDKTRDNNAERSFHTISKLLGPIKLKPQN